MSQRKAQHTACGRRKEERTWFEESEVNAGVAEDDVRSACETVEGFVGRHANAKARGEGIHYEMADTRRTQRVMEGFLDRTNLCLVFGNGILPRPTTSSWGILGETVICMMTMMTQLEEA